MHINDFLLSLGDHMVGSRVVVAVAILVMGALIVGSGMARRPQA
jgi:hypothetical protein